MGTIVMEFANQLFAFTAIKYAMDPKRKPEEPSAEECNWTSGQFSIDIGHAVLMLSYTYRSAFKRHFQKVSQVICSSREASKLYPVIFAKVTYKCHCPFKILVLCSFISEMYLHIYFKTGSSDPRRHYIVACMISFNDIYKSVLSEIDDPIPKWNDVKWAATLVAKGHSILEPIMNTEHPSQDKLFFDSVTEVTAGKGNAPKTKDSSEIFGDEATNEPSKTAVTQQSISQTSKASASKGNPSIIHQYTPLTKKGKKRMLAKMKLELAAKAAIRRNASESKETAGTSTANLSLEGLRISGASLDTSSVEEKISTEDSAISFGTVDEITSKIPGFDECDKHEGKMDKPEAQSASSVAKAKSKKQKKKN